jgi:ribonuclease P protein component
VLSAANASLSALVIATKSSCRFVSAELFEQHDSFGRNPSRFAMTASSKADSRTATSAVQRSGRASMAAYRLCKHADYQHVYGASRKRRSASMSWFLAPQPVASTPRVGLTAGKVLGKSHERNRIKRRMREILRKHIDLLPAGCDLILHPQRIVMTMDFTKLEGEVVRILEQANAQANAERVRSSTTEASAVAKAEAAR